VKRVSFTNKSATAHIAVMKNKASAVAAADTPDERFCVPANTTVNVFFGEAGMYMSTGIAIGWTTSASPDTVAALAANDAHYAIEYI
jgi:hypothetical protein